MKPHRWLLPIIGPIFLATRAHAQDPKSEIVKCAAIAGATERLACFDALAHVLGGLDRGGGGGAGRAAGTPATGATGEWRVSTKTSLIDNSQNVFLTLDANESITGLGGRVQPTLIIRCKEGRTDAAVIWGVYLGLDTTSVLTRLDEEKATTALWDISTDNKATFHQRAEKFLRQLVGHQKLLAEVIPYGESPALVTFSIAGLDEAAKPLREACRLK